MLLTAGRIYSGRQYFLVSNMIYFDNSATTKPCDEVIYTLNSDLTGDCWGNPGSLHNLGTKASNAYSDAVKSCASFIGASSDEVFFTSCGTESANMIIEGYMTSNPRAGRTVISTKTEHKCSLESLALLEKRGYNVIYIPVDKSGKPQMDVLEENLSDDVALMCFTHVNNETGSILPIDEIVKLKKVRCPKACIYLDCVQSLGKLPINVKTLGIDMASFSAHKIHGIKGVGLAYIRKNIKVSPLIIGGGQQNGMRSGTQSLPLADSMAVAMRTAEENREAAYKTVASINEYLREELIKREAVINSPEDGLPFVLNVAFKNFQSETMLHCLEMYEVYISTVSACSSKSKKTSYVLENMGIDRKISSNSVRLSFSRYNTMDEAKRFVEVIDEIYKLYEVKVR